MLKEPAFPLDRFRKLPRDGTKAPQRIVHLGTQTDADGQRLIALIFSALSAVLAPDLKHVIALAWPPTLRQGGSGQFYGCHTLQGLQVNWSSSRASQVFFLNDSTKCLYVRWSWLCAHCLRHYTSCTCSPLSERRFRKLIMYSVASTVKPERHLGWRSQQVGSLKTEIWVFEKTNVKLKHRIEAAVARALNEEPCLYELEPSLGEDDDGYPQLQDSRKLQPAAVSTEDDRTAAMPTAPTTGSWQAVFHAVEHLDHPTFNRAFMHLASMLGLDGVSTALRTERDPNNHRSLLHLLAARLARLGGPGQDVERRVHLPTVLQMLLTVRLTVQADSWQELLEHKDAGLQSPVDLMWGQVLDTEYAEFSRLSAWVTPGGVDIDVGDLLSLRRHGLVRSPDHGSAPLQPYTFAAAPQFPPLQSATTFIASTQPVARFAATHFTLPLVPPPFTVQMMAAFSRAPNGNMAAAACPPSCAGGWAWRNASPLRQLQPNGDTSSGDELQDFLATQDVADFFRAVDAAAADEDQATDQDSDTTRASPTVLRGMHADNGSSDGTSSGGGSAGRGNTHGSSGGGGSDVSCSKRRRRL